MNSQSSPTTPPSSTPVEGPRKTPVKALWAAVAVLAVAAAAFGGMLLGQNRQSPTNTPTAVSAPAFSTGSTAPNDGVPPPPLASAPNALAANPSPEPVRAPPVQPSPASSPAAAPGAVADASAPPAVAPAPPAPICKTCGHVESIRTVQREQPTSGVGAVAGGVLGGVLGNQIGSGNGRTAATVLGAVGGGYVGNTVEKRTHTITRYQVAVRMDDGSIRTVETRSAPPVGKAVTLKGGVLRPADRRL